MWRDKQDIQRREPDSPMKQMARQLLASEAEQEETSLPPIRQANLADRFGQRQGPVQELFANLEAQAEEEATAEAAKPEEEPAGDKSDQYDKPSPKAALDPLDRKEDLTREASPGHPLLRRPQRKLDHSSEQSTSPKIRQATFPLARLNSTPISPTKPRQFKDQTRQILDKNRKSASRRQGQTRFKSLQEALVFSRDQFPLPKEIQMRQKPEHRTWLLSQVQACRNERELRQFAYSLSTRDLSILFPCLASLKTGEEIDKLLHIIALRASKYLYLQGWITLQYAYPRSTVQKGLALLCEILEDNNQRQSGLTAMEYQGLQLGQDRFDWESVHLISEISLPNTRHFMSSIIKFLRDSGLSGPEFFQRYGIYRDLALGQAIIGQWDMAVFESNLHSNNPLQNLF